MIRLDCAGRASAVAFATIIALCAGSSPAAAKRHPHRHAATRPVLALRTQSDDAMLPGLPDPSVSVISTDGPNAPAVLHSTRHIYCVEFARLRSGIEVYGDAKTWWDRAKAEYAESGVPSEGAVMVFAGSRRMQRGHVAVVSHVVSPREIRVDHANWGRDGEIYLNAPVIDVSAGNDWSRVRVWNTRGGQMGSHVYAIRGFVSLRSAAALAAQP